MKYFANMTGRTKSPPSFLYQASALYRSMCLLLLMAASLTSAAQYATVSSPRRAVWGQDLLRDDSRQAFEVPGLSEKKKKKKKQVEEEVPDSLANPWLFGLNVGFSFPSNFPANFYNGSPGNENKATLIFGNTYYMNQIMQKVNEKTGYVMDTADPYELPTRMRYNPAVCVGFYVKYLFSESYGAFAQFNFTKLTASDALIINLVVPNNMGSEPGYRQYTIYGKEKRTDIDLGISRNVDLGEKTKLCLETGLNVNNTLVLENKVQIEDLSFSLVNVYGNQSYSPGYGLQEYQVRQGGIGYGIFATGTLRLIFNESLSMDPGFSFYWKKVNLPGYSEFKPAFNVFVRFSFSKIW